MYARPPALGFAFHSLLALTVLARENGPTLISYVPVYGQLIQFRLHTRWSGKEDGNEKAWDCVNFVRLHASFFGLCGRSLLRRRLPGFRIEQERTASPSRGDCKH